MRCGPLGDPAVEAPGGATGKKQAPWNDVDFFVAVGENQHRNWDGMRRYGFVSAGHGDKYRKAMSNLFESDRVWAAIPGTGYVGAGEITAPAVAVGEFQVEVDGQAIPILQAPLQAANMGEDAGDRSRASTSHESDGSTLAHAIKRSGTKGCSRTRT